MKKSNKKNSKMIKKIIKLIISLIILCMIFGLGVFTNKIISSKSSTIKFGFEDASELVTQTYHIEKVKDINQCRILFNNDKLIIPGTTSQSIFSYYIDVDASVDFSKITKGSQDDNNKTITINLPHASIYKTSLDYESFKNYFEKNSPFSTITSEDYNNAQKELVDEATQEAINDGIIEKADKNVKILLENYIHSDKNYKDYHVLVNYID